MYRPADGNETSGAYASALLHEGHPAIFALSRQNLPQLAGSSVEKALRGGYTVYDSAGDVDAAGAPALIVASSGSEVTLAIDGAKALAASSGKRIAVASFPCLEVFESQAPEYRRSVLREGVPVLSIEASAVRGWERYAHAHLGLKTFGASAPAGDLMKYFGLTADGVAEKAKKIIAAYGKAAPLLPVNGPDF